MQILTAEKPLALVMDRPIRPCMYDDLDPTRDEGTLAGVWIVPSVLVGAALWFWGITTLFG
mgnify:CR=1 FL=1